MIELGSMGEKQRWRRFSALVIRQQLFGTHKMEINGSARELATARVEQTNAHYHIAPWNDLLKAGLALAIRDGVL